MPKDKRSFFERLTGSYSVEEEEKAVPSSFLDIKSSNTGDVLKEEIEEEEGQLTLDMYQTPDEIVVQAFVAGVKPEDLDVSITREMVTVRGRRQDVRRAEKDNFFYQELYWGAFSRSILLPQEVDPDEADASQKGGVLTIRLPKLDKKRVQKLRIKGE